MFDVKITAVKKVCHKDLIEKYENPIEHACDLKEGDEWISNDGFRPVSFYIEVVGGKNASKFW